MIDAGYAIGPEREDVFEGAGAARIDSLAVEPDGNRFGNLVQSVDATRIERSAYASAPR